MRKILFSIPLVFSLCAIMLSCNSKSKSGGSGDAYTLKMRLEKNDSFSQDMDMVMDMDMEIMGQKMTTKMNMETKTDFKVLDVKGDSKELSMVLSKMAMGGEVKMPDGTSQQTPQTNTDYMVGKVVTLTLDNNNKVIATQGTDSLFDGNPDLDPATKEQLRKMFSKEQINNMYAMIFQLLPEKPVRVGEEWEKVNVIPMGGIEMKVTTTYKLLSVKDGIATLDMKGKIDGEGSMEAQGNKLTMDLEGGQNGTIEIWQNTGYIKDGKYEMDFEGKMNMMGQSVPVKAKGKYVISGK